MPNNWNDIIGNVAIKYGASFVNSGGAPQPSVQDIVNQATDHAAMLYGAQTGLDEAQEMLESQVTRQARDDWWKWALGAGVVSLAAFAIYMKYR